MERELHVIDHPLVQHKLTLLRDKEVSTQGFRALTHEIGALVAYELMRTAPTRAVTVQTPVGEAHGVELDGKKVVLVAILRAGLGMLDGMLTVIPSARVGHVGLYREPKLRTAVEYYLKLPTACRARHDRDLVRARDGRHGCRRCPARARVRRALGAIRVFGGEPRRCRELARSTSQRAHLHLRGRPRPRRKWLHFAWPRRRGR